MFDRLKKVFSEERTETAPEDVERRTSIAASVLLLEAAHADEECTPEEMDQVVAALGNRFEMPAKVVAELIALAHAEREEAVDLWQFTDHLNRHLPAAARLAIMTDVWRIIHADGVLERHEDHLAHKLATLLRLTHSQLIEAKLKARGNPEGARE